MSIYIPRLSTAAYAVIIILFFFPFINVKCNHAELERVKGIELATGYRIGTHAKDSLQQAMNAADSVASSFHQTGNRLKHANDLNTDRNNFATAALLLAIAGLVLSFLLQWRREMLHGIIGLAGMMSLFLMRVQLDNAYAHHDTSTTKIFGDDITIEYETGYWLVLISFFLIAAINIYSYIEQLKNGEMKIGVGLHNDDS